MPNGSLRSALLRLLPRTMGGLVVSGSLLAAAPLLVAAMLAETTLDRLISESETLIHESVSLERQGGQLRDEINALERNVRQFAVIGDPGLLGVIHERIASADSALQRLASLKYRDALEPGRSAIAASLGRLHREWQQPPADPAVFDESVRQIRTTAEHAAAALRAGRAQVDGDLEQLRSMTDTARWTMWISLVSLVLLTLLLAAALSAVVSRPVRRMSLGIAALGHARYHQRFDIGYPDEMRRLGELLDWLRRKLAQLESDKNAFLRNVSHELKTPLATQSEGFALLRDGSLGLLSPRQTEVVGILTDAAEDLQRRITGLLTYAAWREGRRQEGRCWFELQPLVEQSMADLRLLMERRGLVVELDLRSPRLFGQPAQWRVVLDNLIGNAVKHAPPGTAIEVGGAVVNGRCQLWVRDRGPGVPDPEKERIFEPYVRGEGAIEAGIPGSGIGLAVVRETVQAHGGTTEVEDANPGARFRLEWPSDRRVH